MLILVIYIEIQEDQILLVREMTCVEKLGAG